MNPVYRISLLFMATLAGCSSSIMPAASPPGPTPVAQPAPLLAGAARVEITPVPGVSTFGHGPDARVTEGIWTRLYCRAFVLETANSAGPIAVVPCDLPAISALLQRRVAAQVADILPASRLMLTATHTHAGPAHYFEAKAYSGIISTQLPGHDERMVEFLSQRIAGAVRIAHAKRVWAQARWVHGSMWGLTRNRSLQAFYKNRPQLTPRTPPPAELPEDRKAIDPALDILELESLEARPAGQHRPLGWLAFYAMHPTVLGSDNRLLGADVAGVVSRELERELRTASVESHHAHHDPLVAIVNTNEGDMSPTWKVGDAAEAVSIGQQIASRIWQTHQGSSAGVRRAITLDSRYLEVDLPDRKLLDGRGSVCTKPELSLSAAHGASDHPTYVPDVFPGRHTDPSRKDCQGPKRRGMPLAGEVPSRIPLGLLRIDDTWLSFVPFEMTSTAGNRVNDAVRAIAGRVLEKPVALVAGLSNGYGEYVTTWEEYQVQEYEGQSTLFGPWSAAFLAEQLGLLTRAMQGEDVSPYLPASPRIGEATPYPYSLGSKRDRLATGDGELPLSSILDRRRAQGMCTMAWAGASTQPPAVCFWWTDGGPGVVPIQTGPWLQLVMEDAHRSPVRSCGGIQVSSCELREAIDDRGADFFTRVHTADHGVFVWSTVFQPQPAEWKHIQSLAGAVRLRARHAPPIASIESWPFSPSAMPPPCTDEASRYCRGER